MTRPIAAAFITAFLTVVRLSATQAVSLDFIADLQPGPHDVGFRLLIETDKTRPALPESSDESGRVMPIAIWYPSARHEPRAARLRVDDYVRISAQALSGRSSDDGLSAFQQRYGAADSDRLERLRQSPMLAARDVAPERGRFPLVLFAHAAPDSQSVMAEHLASHGFVVAAVRSRGTAELAYRLSRENLDTMTADLAFAWARLQREPYVRTGPAVFIGMSNGSIGSMAVQLRAPRMVAGVVSLDGGIGEDAGGTYLRERSNDDPRRLRAPLLHFYTEPNPRLNFAHVRSYEGADRTLVLVKGVRHTDFLNDALFDKFLTGDARAYRSAEGFVWVARYTLRFVQAVMSDRKGDWLEGGEPPPSEWVTIERLAGRL